MFVFCLFVRHATLLGTESPDGAYKRIELGGTGIRPPDSFSYRSSFRFRSSFRSRSNFRSSFSFSFSFRSSFRFRFRSRSHSSSCSTTSGDIFYCSCSRQLNHSSFKLISSLIGDGPLRRFPFRRFTNSHYLILTQTLTLTLTPKPNPITKPQF